MSRQPNEHVNKIIEGFVRSNPEAICRHAPGDPECGKGRYAYSTPTSSVTPDSQNYEIMEVERVGPHVVLKVKYPNCAACSYEGNKVMVFLNVTEVQILKWRRIDPHFRNPLARETSDEAPSPAARFPASADGWGDALMYARGKLGTHTR